MSCIEWNDDLQERVDALPEGTVWSLGPTAKPVVVVLLPDADPEWTCPECGYYCDLDDRDLHDDGDGRVDVACPGPGCSYWDPEG